MKILPNLLKVDSGRANFSLHGDMYDLLVKSSLKSPKKSTACFWFQHKIAFGNATEQSMSYLYSKEHKPMARVMTQIISTRIERVYTSETLSEDARFTTATFKENTDVRAVHKHRLRKLSLSAPWAPRQTKADHLRYSLQLHNPWMPMRFPFKL